MSQWEIPDLIIDEDAVLRGQGADPHVIRKRSPKLIEISKRAIKEGQDYLEPKVIFKKLFVESFRHKKLELENSKRLSGSLIADQLFSAKYVVLLLCTVGDRLEEYISSVIKDEITYGFALDGVGSAAVEALANAACKYFEDEAAKEGFQSSIPLSPGMIGWEVNEGQRQIFEILDASQINVELMPNSMMTPRKSLTTVIGFGPKMNPDGKTCDYCQMAETCKYKDHYEITS